MEPWLLRFVSRAARVALGDPYDLARFGPRVLGAAGLVADDLVRLRVSSVVVPIVSQVTKTFFRGIWAVLFLGVAVGAGLRAIAVAVGVMVEPIVEAALARVLLRDAIPLLVAVFLAARTGATLAAKLGQLPTRWRLPRMTVRREQIRDLVLPSLVAGCLTGLAFYHIIVVVAVQGYQTTEMLTSAGAWYPRTPAAPAWSEGLELGGLKSATFGLIVAYVGSALGVAAAERYRVEVPETLDVHNAVWETTVFSTLLCVTLTLSNVFR